MQAGDMRRHLERDHSLDLECLQKTHMLKISSLASGAIGSW